MLTIRSATPEDRPRLAKLEADSFSGADWSYDWIYNYSMYQAERRPGFQYEQVRVGWVDDTLVTQLAILPMQITYGRSTLDVGGISSVCTDPAYRGNAYAADLMRDAIVYMKLAGSDMSLLDGLPGYYDRLGYANVWPSRYIEIQPRGAAPLSERLGSALAALTVRDLTPDDYPAMLALYQQSWGRHPGARLRDLDHLAWRMSWAFPYQKGAVDASGKLRGYMVGYTHNKIEEVVAPDEETTAALLLESVAALMERETDIEARDAPFTWKTAHDTPVARHVRALCPALLVTETVPNGGWMGRVINLRNMMEKLLPELQARIQASSFAGWVGRLRIETDIGQVTLTFSQGRLALGRHMRESLVTRIAQTDLIQLIFSYATPTDVIARQGIHLDAETTGLLNALFPQRICDIAGIDWF